MARSFKHTTARPADYVEPTSLPSSPLTDVDEMDFQTWGSHWSESRLANPAPSMSPKEMAAAEAAFGLPKMLPKGKDNLCALPMRRTDAICPDGPSRFVSGLLTGTGVVRVKAHKLSASMDQYPQPRRVGIDAPWAPNALTPIAVREAHERHAAEFWRGGARVPLALPDAWEDLADEESAFDEEQQDSYLRTVDFWDRRADYPLGPAAGEEYIISDAEISSEPPRTLPMRPIGVFDPAETLLYAHNQRKKALQQLIAQKKKTWEQAAAIVEAAAGRGQTWAQMQEEAETVEMVLREYEKLEPVKGWNAEQPKEPLTKVKVKRLAAFLAAGDAVEGEEIAAQDLSTSESDAGSAGASADTSTPPAAVESPQVETLNTTRTVHYHGHRSKRVRSLTAKAKALVESAQRGVDGCECEESAPPAKRRRKE